MEYGHALMGIYEFGDVLSKALKEVVMEDPCLK
jgi:hypothetical protein